ncbi:hypothetical protein AC578_10757 [Pseudocercospora eumusae]|uniref:F-box domain-containing protein n=1 Tax=Pseudocercospora eumusae TaxID=321146 RepID=A0A139GZX9_9PEZI|nr:hypothetical protein AC578_10757 [Pseudocercospora eumusae]
MAAGKADNMEATTTVKPPTTFLSLPAELRNYIYDLSGCLLIDRCCKAGCNRAATRDISGKYFIKCYGPQYGRARVRCLATSSLWTLIPVDIRGTRRKMIYYKSPKDPGTLRRSAPAAKQPALTRVSRAIRQETLPMFYGQNRFVIWTHKPEHVKATCEKFLKTIGQSNAALLRTLVVSVGSIDEAFEPTSAYTRRHGMGLRGGEGLQQLQDFTTEIRRSARSLGVKQGVLFYMGRHELEKRTGRLV